VVWGNLRRSPSQGKGRGKMEGLLLYDIELNGLDLDAVLRKKVNGLFYLRRLALKLKGHDADFISDRGLPDIGKDLEFPDTLAKKRLPDLFLRICKIYLFFQSPFPPAMAGIMESSSLSFSSVLRLSLKRISSSLR